VAVEQEVQIERARALRRPRAPVSSEGALELEQCAQQRAGRQRRLELYGPVEETGLVEVVDGLGVAEARDALDLDLREPTHAADRCPQRLPPLSEIGSQADEGTDHGRTIG